MVKWCLAVLHERYTALWAAVSQDAFVMLKKYTYTGYSLRVSFNVCCKYLMDFMSEYVG